MATDDDDADDVGGSRPPLPPADRLWRHPSELREHGWSGAALEPSPPARGTVGWRSAILAGLAGAALTTGAIAASGALSTRVVERAVVEKVAVVPVVSSPMLQDERGVDAVVERMAPAVVHLDVPRAEGTASGSGVLFRDDGLVLTSAQVVTGADVITVTLADGRTVVGHLLGTDPATDVAVVDLEGDGFPVAILGHSEGLEVGAPTVAIGSSVTGSDPTVATGVVSALARRVEAASGAVLHGMIQTDAPTVAGAAGGALVDATGAVIGITTEVTGGASRFGFATPIDLAHMVAEQILRTGHMDRGWLGIDGEDLPPEQAREMGLRGGAVVRSVAAGSPAARAGLLPFDVITELDGHPLTSVSALVVELLDHHAGDRITIVHWRLGQRIETAVDLGAPPERG